MSGLPQFETLLLERAGRRLTVTMNRPGELNAFNGAMHREIVAALEYAGSDPNSDVIVITGAGRAFSAGGDIGRMQHFVDHPDDFVEEAEGAKRLVFALLDIEKPIVARINGPAVGLGATIALFCDVTIASGNARIGDPHVAIGLVAGDGGAVIWPQLVGFHRAKEFLLTGEILTAERAEKIGLVNHVVPEGELDAAVDAMCDRLLKGAQQAVRWTKATINIELRRIAEALMEPGMAYESQSVRTEEHRKRVEVFVRRSEKKR